MSNPFMGRAPEESAATSGRLDADPVLGTALAARGPQVPPLSLPAGADGAAIGLVAAVHQPTLWLLGLHGGCGVSTVRELFPAPGEVEERTTWPYPDVPGARSRVLLVARTHARGLDRLGQAAAQWAGGTFPHIDLVGTVLVADGPKPPKALQQQLRRAVSLTPMTWHIGWNESWRSLTAAERHPDSLRVRLSINAILRRVAQLPPMLDQAAMSHPVAQEQSRLASNREAG